MIASTYVFSISMFVRDLAIHQWYTMSLRLLRAEDLANHPLDGVKEEVDEGLNTSLRV